LSVEAQLSPSREPDALRGRSGRRRRL